MGPSDASSEAETTAGGPDPTAAAEPAAGSAGDQPPEYIDLDKPPPGLPDLTFPGSVDESRRELAAAQRRRRLRIEIYGAIGLAAIGVVAGVLMQTPAVLGLTLAAIAVVLVYEFLVVNLQ